MTPSEMNALRASQDEARLAVQCDESLVIAMARMLVGDWKQGKTPGTTELVMLTAAVEQHRTSQERFQAALAAVNAAYDAAVGRRV